MRKLSGAEDKLALRVHTALTEECKDEF